MNASDRKQGGFGALASGLARGLQWRLLVLWAVGLALPALAATLPLWFALSARLDHAIQSSEIAQRFDIASAFEVMTPLMRESGDMFNGALVLSGLLTLLIAPWLTGMVVASIRAGQALRFANLLQYGLREYGRMFRMLLWALLPLGVAFGLFGAMGKWAEGQASTAILQSNADNANRVALIVFGIAFLVAHATVEAGRGVLAADPSRRSVVKAWWRGVLLCARRPLAVLVVYVGTLLVGEGLALGLGFVRTQVSGATTGGFVAGVLLVQLVVMAVAWGRIARLYGMSALAGDAQRWHAMRHARKEEAPAHHAGAPTPNEALATPVTA